VPKATGNAPAATKSHPSGTLNLYKYQNQTKHISINNYQTQKSKK
jgi:hypothetical protein